MKLVPAWLMVVTALLGLTALALCVLVWVGWPELWHLVAARLAHWQAESAGFWLGAAAVIAASIVPFIVVVFWVRQVLLR